MDQQLSINDDNEEFTFNSLHFSNVLSQKNHGIPEKGNTSLTMQGDEEASSSWEVASVQNKILDSNFETVKEKEISRAT